MHCAQKKAVVGWNRIKNVIFYLYILYVYITFWMKLNKVNYNKHIKYTLVVSECGATPHKHHTRKRTGGTVV